MAGSGVKSALGLALLLLAIRQLGQLVEANEIWTEMDKDELVSWSRPAVTILTGHKDLTLGNVGDVIEKEIEEDRENRDKKGDEDYTIKLTKMAWLEIVCNENGIRGPYIYKDWLINLKKLLIADPHLKPILVECFSLQVNKLLQLEAYELKNARYSYQEQELMDSLSVPETVLDGGAKSNQRIGCLFGLSCMDFFRKRDRTSHKDVLHALEGAVSAIELFKNVHDGKLPAIFKEKSDKYNELLSLCNDEEIDSETRAERLALIEKYRETDPHLTAYLDECYLKQTRANGKGGE